MSRDIKHPLFGLHFFESQLSPILILVQRLLRLGFVPRFFGMRVVGTCEHGQACKQIGDALTVKHVVHLSADEGKLSAEQIANVSI
jgi:hypothetical protein